jgi:FAD/FMN-containing dehydrogenase
MTDMLTPVLGEATIQELREAVRGEVLARGDDGFEEACTIWNGMFDDREPALVVRCRGAADAIAAVGFARSNDLDIAVRGGGHSVAGFSSCDDGIVIDLSALRTVHVDPAGCRALVGAGSQWAEVDHECQAHGLATTGGLVSTTGVAGFTLGGGLGWLMRKHGLACDNLVGADVVTADGRLVRASEDENPELLWGLRGGGGNFGIVTQFELAVHPVGPTVYAGVVLYPPEDGAELLRRLRSWGPSAPDEVTALVNLTSAPPLPPVPTEWHGKKVAALLAVCAGPVEEGEALVRQLREAGEPIADLLGPMPYTAMQSLLDPLWPKGMHAYFKASNLAELDDETIGALCRLHLEAPGTGCEIHVHQMGGAVGRVSDDGTAFGERAPFVLNAVAGWHDPTLTAAHVAWARNVNEAAAAAATGRAYVNYLGDEGSARAAYGPENYARLVALKDEYDPTNVFRLNQNVAPSGS